MNIMEFCKDFNARTAGIKKGTPLPTRVQLRVGPRRGPCARIIHSRSRVLHPHPGRQIVFLHRRHSQRLVSAEEGRGGRQRLAESRCGRPAACQCITDSTTTSNLAGTQDMGSISLRQIYEVAKIKQQVRRGTMNLPSFPLLTLNPAPPPKV